MVAHKWPPMDKAPLPKRVLLVGAATALLVGCSLGTRGLTSVPPAEVRPAMRIMAPAREGQQPPIRFVYVSDSGQGSVYRYDRAGNLTLTIGGFVSPNGLIVDAHGNLLVADKGAQAVLIFHRGATTPFKTLDDTGQAPVDVAVCPNGTVYVSNVDTNHQTGQGNIAVYAHGSTKATSFLNDPRELSNISVACDDHNNVFSAVAYAWFPNRVMTIEKYVRGERKNLVVLPIAPDDPVAGGLKPIGRNILVGDANARTATEYSEDGKPTGRQLYEEPMSGGIAVSRNGQVVLAAGGGEFPGAISWLFPSGAQRHSYIVRNRNPGPGNVAFDEATVQH